MAESPRRSRSEPDPIELLNLLADLVGEPSPADAARDKLWDSVYYTFYECAYNESIADRLVDRWQLVDEVTKVLIAITASGSAVSGWALWNEPGFKSAWTSLAAVAAILSIFHTSVGVSSKLREWIVLKRAFAALRIDLETFRYRMRIDEQFPSDKYTQEFADYRRRYSEAVQRLSNDTLLTKTLKLRVQEELKKRVQRDGR